MNLYMYAWFKVFLTLLGVWPLSSLFTEYIAKRYNLTKQRLPDLLQIITESQYDQLKPLRKLKDILSFLPTVYAVFILRNDPKLFNDFTNYMCGLVILRCLFFSVTILPTSSDDVQNKGRIERLLTGGKHDLIFSGHVSYYYAACLFLSHYKLWYAFDWFIAFSTWLIAFFSVVLRDHYTVDVMVVFPVVHFWKSYFLIKTVTTTL